MNDLSRMPTRYATERPICVAVLAMGGQGGGVLTDWIVELAESRGWHAQSTSMSGVAQRTGATLYYVEMLPPKGGKAPILSLMPAPGEVDVVLAAELMEAGRSILRGLVTPDRSTLIASTHRLYSVAEKEKPGDAIADPNVVMEAADVAAKRVIAFDMEVLANRNNSVISACLFGALAGVRHAPVRARQLRGGHQGRRQRRRVEPECVRRRLHRRHRNRRAARAAAPLPPSLQSACAAAGLRRASRARQAPRPHPRISARRCTRCCSPASSALIDFQDPAYAGRVSRSGDEILRPRPHAMAARSTDYALTTAAAKYIAVAMAYDDVIRVAELKTAASRFERVERDNAVGDRTDRLHHRIHAPAPRGGGRHPAGVARALRSKRIRACSAGRSARAGACARARSTGS